MRDTSWNPSDSSSRRSRIVQATVSKAAERLSMASATHNDYVMCT